VDCVFSQGFIVEVGHLPANGSWEDGMAVEPLSLRHLRVLGLIGNGLHGRADVKLIAQFATEIFELIAAGLMEVHSETVTEFGRTIETVCVRITAAGRKALEG
jgi:hypothetical protein